MAEKIAVPESAKVGDTFDIRLTGDSWDSNIASTAGLSRGEVVQAKLTDASERDEFEIIGHEPPSGVPFVAYLPDSGEAAWLCEVVKAPELDEAQEPKVPLAVTLSSDPGPGESFGAAESVDMVNSPPHYVSGGLEVIDVIEAFELDRKSGHLQNVVKYALRAGDKGDLQTDVDKLVWYALRLQKRVRENGGTF